MIFFFQAEDGIRDIGVTGVQTCALPIFAIDMLHSRRLEQIKEEADTAARQRLVDLLMEELHARSRGRNGRDSSGPGPIRLEERRFGKACRSRWSTYH